MGGRTKKQEKNIKKKASTSYFESIPLYVGFPTPSESLDDDKTLSPVIPIKVVKKKKVRNIDPILEALLKGSILEDVGFKDDIKKFFVEKINQ